MGVGYTPVFEIPELNSLQKRILSISIDDNPGYQSDTASLTINMHGLSIDELPKSGQKVSIYLGWKEVGLYDMGRFTLGKTKVSYHPKRVTITALASPFNADPGTEAKLRRSETYAQTTINEIVKACASRLKLTPRVHPELQSIVVEHEDQVNETDLSFLQRIENKYDAVVKPIDGLLIFSKRGQLKNLSGKTYPPVELALVSPNTQSSPHNAFQMVEFDIPERVQFRGVTADWYDEENAKIIKLEKGKEPFKQIPGRFKGPKEAFDQIESELKRIKRNGIHTNFQVAGNPEIQAEGAIVLSGFDEDRLNGAYSADKVNHSMVAGQSFKTTVTASVPAE